MYSRGVDVIINPFVFFNNKKLKGIIIKQGHGTMALLEKRSTLLKLKVILKNVLTMLFVKREVIY